MLVWQELSDLCAQFSKDHADIRNSRFQSDCTRPVCDRFLVSNPKDFGIHQTAPCLFKYKPVNVPGLDSNDKPQINGEELSEDEKDADEPEDDTDLAKSLQSCFAPDPDDDEDIPGKIKSDNMVLACCF